MWVNIVLAIFLCLRFDALTCGLNELWEFKLSHHNLVAGCGILLGFQTIHYNTIICDGNFLLCGFYRVWLTNLVETSSLASYCLAEALISQSGLARLTLSVRARMSQNFLFLRRNWSHLLGLALDHGSWFSAHCARIEEYISIQLRTS